jgi:hypothetical protein
MLRWISAAIVRRDVERIFDYHEWRLRRCLTAPDQA